MLSWYPDPYRYDVKNTRVPFAHNMSYVVRHLRGPVVWSGLICGVYGLVDCVMEQVRDPSKTSTWVNSTVAGAASGLVMGGMSRRFDVMATAALGVGIVMGMVEYNGQGGKSNRQAEKERFQWWLPAGDSESVKELKEQYPEYKNL